MLTRQPSTNTAKTPAIHERPEVKDFLNNFALTVDKLKQMEAELRDSVMLNQQLEVRIQTITDDLYRAANARDMYMAQLSELRIQFEVLCTTAITACEKAGFATREVIDQAKSSLDAVKKADVVKKLDDKTDQQLLEGVEQGMTRT